MDDALTKATWTDADFETMGWHDCHVHAFGASPETYEFLLDIDYILRWEKPLPEDGRYTFWVAPATLVFHNASDVNIAVGPGQGDITILELKREDAQLTPNKAITDWYWSTFGVGGHFNLRATGFTQYLKQRPRRVSTQQLSPAERGGLSFAREPYACD